jgi:hypothetical protein
MVVTNKKMLRIAVTDRKMLRIAVTDRKMLRIVVPIVSRRGAADAQPSARPLWHRSPGEAPSRTARFVVRLACGPRLNLPAGPVLLGDARRTG